MDALLNKTVYQLGESVKVRAMVRDEHGDATRFAQVNMTLTGGDGKPRTLSLPPAQSHLGMYEIVVADLGKGEYHADLVATKDGKELGRSSLKFTVIPPADEMLKIAANPKALAAIADETHGFHYDLAEFASFIDQLIRGDPQSTQASQKSVPLFSLVRMGATIAGADPAWPGQYDLPMQGALVVICLGVEWFLRRRWQLP
jgi:hypothetical protein